MPFEKDPQFAQEVENFYGEYVATFRSEHDQVRADIFKESGGLLAYVSFAKGVTSGSVGDHYLSDLKEYAKAQGFEGKLRLLMSGSGAT